MLILDIAQPAELESYLKAQGWLARDAAIEALERPGEGNMNLVLRVRTSGGSLIVKQSRPWVEKYPDIEAPVDRICVEAAFYRAVADTDGLAERMPGLIGFDQDNRVALFEDLGDAADFTNLYATPVLETGTMDQLWRWLSELHGLGLDPGAKPVLENRDMRELNHAHIFDIPLRTDNGLDLDGITPGLAELASKLKAHDGYRRKVQAFGEQYLGNGRTLLHGDYYPGSWLQHPTGVKIIDPEFGFFGPAEFDCGVFLAHLHLAGFTKSEVEQAQERYEAATDYSAATAQVFAGIEIMRRLIGVAQLPLAADIERKEELLTLSRELVLES